MPIPSRLFRLCLGALAAAGLCLATFVAGPAPAAHAQANFRVCVAWNSSSFANGIGTGLVVKVYKNGDSTCAQKLQYMKDHYPEAYSGSSVQHTAVMIRCESLAERIGVDGAPCYQLVQNAIYKFTSSGDARYPADNPAFSYWRP
ncbi:hypothetical protein ACMT9U_15200 [Clavibacter sp. Sh2036]|uniref:hypothetical protein n=1 Tax=Clavibacter sp. Sh2036 TaxID=3397677 RepID=UPI0039DFC3A3